MDHVSAALAAGTWPAQPAEREPIASAADVFKALADPSRRLLLDSLFVDDGQTLGQLSARLPGMTRFGAMKHLRLLEAAGLVIARKIGREKLHYLNPASIRLIHDRWTSKYAEPWVGALADLEVSLEAPASTRPRLVCQVYIRSRPETVWRVIDDPHVIEPALRGASVTWKIEPVGLDICKLSVGHDDLPTETVMFATANVDWPLVLSSLKSLLETGAPLALSR
jgi:DNA-binding transcriptional ArsR family regulator